MVFGDRPIKVGTPEDYVFYRDLSKTYPVAVKGEGVYVYDDSGRKYLDAMGGVCVVCLGHHVNEILATINKQFDDICFCYHKNFSNRPQSELAEHIVSMAPKGFSKVYFVSGGSEATETAMKLARDYHVQRAKPTKYKVIGRWNSYHGNTIGALSMSGDRLRRKFYDPYLLNFPHISPCYCYRCPFGMLYPDCNIQCAWELERVIKYEGPENVSAFIGEPISATFGVPIPPKEYWPIIREICDRYDILLIADEVINGFGRTGKNFAIDHWGVIPDLIATGKGISSGYTPLAAVIIHEKVVDAFEKGTKQFGHSFTYVGNPLSCAIGLAVQKYIAEHRLIERVSQLEEYFRKKIERLNELEMVGQVNGKGLLWGLEFVSSKETRALFPRNRAVSEQVDRACFKKGLITFPTVERADGERGDTLLLAPPFVIEERELDQVVEILGDAIQEVQKEALPL